MPHWQLSMRVWKGSVPNRFRSRVSAMRKRCPTDAQLNALFAERLRIETEFDGVKAKKQALPDDSYYDQLEKVLVGLARAQQKIEARQAALGVER